MKFLMLFFVLLVGCSTGELRMYNSDDLQDPDCYRRFGGEWGYCDAPRK